MTELPFFAPFPALRPTPAAAPRLVAPPYDVVSTEEARDLSRGKPENFLHVSRAEIDLEEGTDPHAPEVYEKAAENLRKLEESGRLYRENRPLYYVIRIHMGDHMQTGLAGAASAEAFAANRIRRHEYTRPVKEDDRVRQIRATNAQTGPVLLARQADGRLRDYLAEICAANDPEIGVKGPNGTWHEMWPVTDPGMISSLQSLFQVTPEMYIADGHHRAAAGVRVAREMKNARAGILSVVFPADEMRILDYNRVVTDLNGLSTEAFLDAVRNVCAVEESAAPVMPKRGGTYGLYVDGRWFALTVRTAPPDHPVDRLDAKRLTDLVLAPILGIEDLRTSERIDFVGGVRGSRGLVGRVDSGNMAAAFACPPPSFGDIMAVADAGEVMPPKSTWFEPKLLDGLVSLPLKPAR